MQRNDVDVVISKSYIFAFPHEVNKASILKRVVENILRR